MKWVIWFVDPERFIERNIWNKLNFIFNFITKQKRSKFKQDEQKKIWLNTNFTMHTKFWMKTQKPKLNKIHKHTNYWNEKLSFKWLKSVIRNILNECVLLVFFPVWTGWIIPHVLNYSTELNKNTLLKCSFESMIDKWMYFVIISTKHKKKWGLISIGYEN